MEDNTTPPQRNFPSKPYHHASKRILLLVILFLFLALLSLIATLYAFQKEKTIMKTNPLTTSPTPSPIPTESTVFCTMDAKVCPDGSSVGRIPPSCEFAACPGN